MGPLAGFRIVELAGIGPGPMCAMMLSDMGADVIRVDRVADSGLGMKRDPRYDLLNRGRRSVAVDMKTEAGRGAVLRLVGGADGLIEGFRPGVTERLGIGPDQCLARNPRLVYGRMTGWGQDGPIAHAAGHDINYIALTGALHAVGSRGGPPVPALNLIGDFGGGGLYLAFGMVCGLLEAERSGKGQVVDSAMTDGSASLMTMVYGMFAAGAWEDERGRNAVDGGSHFYAVYETKDGKHVSIGSIEDKFYAEFLERTGVDPASLPEQFNRERVAEHVGPVRGGLQDEDPRRVVRDHGGERRMLRAGALARGSPRPPPQPGTGDVREGGRSGSARAGSPLQPHRAEHPAPARPPGRAYRRGPCRLGFLGRGDRGPACARRNRRRRARCRRGSGGLKADGRTGDRRTGDGLAADGLAGWRALPRHGGSVAVRNESTPAEAGPLPAGRSASVRKMAGNRTLFRSAWQLIGILNA